jgi:hypothetical protein
VTSVSETEAGRVRAGTSDPEVPLCGIEPGADGAYPVADRGVTMPVHIRRARMASATFAVPSAAAERIVAPTGLRPAVQGGRALVVLALVKYDDGDLDTYDELGLAFAVEPPSGEPPVARGSMATYIHKLPVDQAFTCEAGRGIWGFPKWIADLRVTIAGDAATASLRNADGSPAVEIGLRRGRIPVPSRPLTMVCYSQGADGRLRRTSWTTRTRGMRALVGRGASVTVGHGPFAEELRALGFPRRPLATMVSRSMEASFDAPVTL